MGETNQAVTPQLSAERLAGTFPGDLGIELTEITDEHVLGHMTVDRRHLHPMGYVHGGAWVAFADTVAAWGTLRHLPDGRGFTTVELKINVITSAGEGDLLTAIGEPLHVGSRTHVWQVRVQKAEGGTDGRAASGDALTAAALREQRLAASFTCTQMVL